jgi:hypothetical protein
MVRLVFGDLRKIEVLLILRRRRRRWRSMLIRLIDQLRESRAQVGYGEFLGGESGVSTAQETLLTS